VYRWCVLRTYACVNDIVLCVFVFQTEVLNPAYDYIPPELVSLLITNNGPAVPSYVYRLLQESISPDDYDI
jgi:translation initiation factor 2B subunit (eIF-2B alpha/beta/delta family)